jgi:D-beta-D-heptose 7-phosphate kinase/D-beta-D-heptose 1-phosphate adenosyltransferase
MALALAAGASLAEAARLANEAAGIVVAKFGPATVTPAELLAACGAASPT